MNLDSEGDEFWRDWKSRRTSDLSKVVPKFWVIMVPMQIHPEFVDWFRQRYHDELAELDDGLYETQIQHIDRDWQIIFGKDPFADFSKTKDLALFDPMEAINTHQVFDWLWSSGQLSKADIQRLPELGIEAVINLALPTSTNALPGEAELVTGLGIAYVQLPVIWEAPTIDRLRQFFRVMRAFEGRKIWVHCAMNMRVSAFIYLYRKLVRNEPEDVARLPMDKIWFPDETWQAFIDEAVKQLSRDY